MTIERIMARSSEEERNHDDVKLRGLCRSYWIS